MTSKAFFAFNEYCRAFQVLSYLTPPQALSKRYKRPLKAAQLRFSYNHPLLGFCIFATALSLVVDMWKRF